MERQIKHNQEHKDQSMERQVKTPPLERHQVLQQLTSRGVWGGWEQ